MNELLQAAISDKSSIESFETSRAGEIILGELEKELLSLKDNADANTVAELKYLKGYKAGVKLVYSVIDRVKKSGQIAHDQVEKKRLRDSKETTPRDSSTL